MDVETEILLYQQSGFPIFQNRMYDSRDDGLNCPKGQLSIVQNRNTGLIYNAGFSAELMTYDSAYQNEQGISFSFGKHLDEVADIISANIAKDGIAEVGCGKGLFLEKLLARGFDVAGFDPTYEGDNTRVKREYFSSTYGKIFYGFVLRHVLEHVQDPVSLVSKIAEANKGRGLIYIEVPCLDWIIAHNAWYDVFYEHVNYFRLDDFNSMFGSVVDSGRLFGGQYLYVVARLDSLRKPVAKQSSLLKPGEFVSFDKSVFAVAPTSKMAIWGGASKGVIFVLMARRNQFQIDHVADINPAKQGKYLAATGHEVISPARLNVVLPSGSNLFVMNSNYLDEIRSASNNAYNYICIEDPVHSSRRLSEPAFHQ
jgi:SAM-dependent methyltransferase